MTPALAAIVVVFCEGFVLWSVFPILNFYCLSLGVPEEHVGIWVGVLLFLQSAPRIVFNPIFGRFSDRVGRGPMMAIASGGTLVGSLIFAIAGNVWWLAVSRLFAGVFGAQATLATATIADHTPPERRAGAMGLLGAAFGISMVLGPLIAGLVAQSLGYSSIGYVSAAFQAVSVVVALRFVTSPPSHAESHLNAPTTPWSALLRLPNVGFLLASGFVLTIAQLQAMATFATYAHTAYAFDAKATGYAFALLGFVAVLTQGGLVRHLAPRFGERPLGIAGLLALSVGAALLAIQPPMAGLIVALIFLGVGGALTIPALTTLAAAAVPQRSQGAMQGALQGVIAFGRSIGSPLGGLLLSVHLSLAYISAAVLALVGAGLMARLQPTPADAPTACKTCGGELRGTPHAGRCPKCGAAAAPSSTADPGAESLEV